MRDREDPEGEMQYSSPPKQEQEQKQDRELERELRQALRHPVPLPEGLAERIVQGVLQAHAHNAPPHPPLRLSARPQQQAGWRQRVAAVLLFGTLMGTGSGYLLSRDARHAQQQLARLRFVEAMQITSTTLEDVQRQLQQQLKQVAGTAAEAPR